jgi:hypothetical protein
MRLAYLTFGGVDSENGWVKKMLSQARAWMARGHEVMLFAISRSESPWGGLADLPIETVKGFTKLARLWRSRALARRVIAWEPDLVYVRWSGNRPGLGMLMERVPSILELNSYDVGGLKSRQSRMNLWYYLATRARVLRKARGLVAVTHEIAGKFADFGKPVLVLGNGIDLSLFPELQAPSNPTPRVAFMGTPRQPWHGLDKIMSLAAHFRQWHFDLVGPSHEDLGSATVPENVSLHGLLGRAEYLQIIAKADVALGTLALHRKGMHEACPLKVREYLAYGIPTIIGYRDTDFPDPVSWLLQIPNTPDNVASTFTMIERFVCSAVGKRVPRDKIRHLDVVPREDQRLAFMDSIRRSRN